MLDRDRRTSFDALIVPHMAAAYNFARWMVRDPHDAEDLTQDAALRAFRALGAVGVRDARTWLLAIVRNVCLSWLARHRGRTTTSFDEEVHAIEPSSDDPEAALLQGFELGRLREAIVDLPIDFREVIVLRDLEGMSYREIAEVAKIPIGTVMSRLARARRRLQERFVGVAGGGA